MRKGLFLFSLLYLLSLGIGVSLASTGEDADPLKRDSKVKGGDPQFKTDSTEVHESAKTYQSQSVELGTFDNTSSNSMDPEIENVETNSSTRSSGDNYYDNEDDSDETTQSMISFNFLYYLLQKFKLSNSLGY